VTDVPSISEHVHIARPIEVVWSFVADSDNTPIWNPLWEHQEVLGGGPMRLGARFLNIGHVGGWRVEAEAEVTRWEPPRRSTVRTIDGPIRAIGSYVLEPEGDGTGFRWELEGVPELGGRIGRLTGSVVTRVGSQGLRAGLERLRTILEAAPPVPELHAARRVPSCGGTDRARSSQAP
jgi:uncharacterized membrane protein